MDVLVATGFFATEGWTLGGLVTYYVLFFIHLGSRKVHVAGVTPHPNAQWMPQVARNLTMAEWGFLAPGHYLIHDRDGKVLCPAFQQIIDEAGVDACTIAAAVAESECLCGEVGPLGQGRVSLEVILCGR